MTPVIQLLKYLSGLAALILTLWLALANRQNVTFSLDPLAPDAPFLAYELPLFALLMGSFAVGILCGGLLIRIILWQKARKSHK